MIVLLEAKVPLAAYILYGVLVTKDKPKAISFGVHILFTVVPVVKPAIAPKPLLVGLYAAPAVNCENFLFAFFLSSNL